MILDDIKISPELTRFLQKNDIYNRVRELTRYTLYSVYSPQEAMSILEKIKKEPFDSLYEMIIFSILKPFEKKNMLRLAEDYETEKEIRLLFSKPRLHSKLSHD